MPIKLSDHFTYHKLIKFVVPSIIMMMFTSIYCVVDGLFVSNFAGTTAFAAVNLIMPVLMILSSIGFMMSSVYFLSSSARFANLSCKGPGISVSSVVTECTL